MVQVGGTTQERGAIDARAAWAQARRAGQDLAGGGAQRSPRKAVSTWPQPRRGVRHCHRGTYLSPVRGSVGVGLAGRGLTPPAESSPAVPASRGPWTLPAAYTWCDPKRTLSEPCPISQGPAHASGRSACTGWSGGTDHTEPDVVDPLPGVAAEATCGAGKPRRVRPRSSAGSTCGLPSRPRSFPAVPRGIPLSPSPA